MSPRTRLIPLVVGLLVLLTACGEPPQALPTSPPYEPASAASTGPTLPSTVATPQPPPPTTYPAYPTPRPTATSTATRTTSPNMTAPTAKSPTPTPSHAAACTGEPTRAQVLTFIKRQSGVPDQPLTVDQGPFCSGDWSFTTVEITGKSEDELEPLMVVTTGRAGTLTLVGAGSDVCSTRVQADAPPEIRVLACGL